METRKLNSSAAGRVMPASWPAAMVDMEREVPGKTAEVTWQRPIQMAWGRDICSTSEMEGSWRTLQASTIHMTIPPMMRDEAMTRRFSRCSPMMGMRASEGIAVQTKATRVRVRGWLRAVCLPSSPLGKVRTNSMMRPAKRRVRARMAPSWMTMVYIFQ